MTDILMPPDLRLIAHRDTTNDLRSLNTTELSDEALVMVGGGSTATLYRLNKFVFPPQGSAGAIFPASGPGVWEPVIGAAGGGVGTMLYATAGNYVIYPAATPGLWEAPTGQFLTIDKPLPGWSTAGPGTLVYTLGPGAAPYFAEFTFTIARSTGTGVFNLDAAVEFNNVLVGTSTTVNRQNEIGGSENFQSMTVSAIFTPNPGCLLRVVTKTASIPTRTPFMQLKLTQLLG